MKPNPSLRVAGLLLLIAVRADAQGKVLVVDDQPGPGVAFTSIQAAVSAAAEGDTVLVKDGAYDESVTLSGKSLAVVADASANVTVLRTLSVTGLGPTQRSLLRGIDAVLPAANPSGEALRLGSNAGPVWVEDGTFDGAHVLGGPAGGMLVSLCGAATIVRCEARGGSGLGSKVGVSKAGGPGLFAIQSSAYAYSSTLRGEDGVQSGSIFGLPAGGGDGATLDRSLLFASGSSLVGGRGADGVSGAFGCVGGGAGGHGVTLIGANSQALLQETGLLPGAGGLGFGACPPGSAGQPAQLFGGTIGTVAGPARSIVVGSPVREGQLAGAVVSGVPGEQVLIGVSATPTPPQLVLSAGAFHLGPNPVVFSAGTVPASGSLVVSAPLGPLTPGVESAVLYVQAGFVSPSNGGVALGAPSTLVVLDSAF